MEPLKNIVVIYHADCRDGFGAAYAAWKKFGDRATRAFEDIFLRNIATRCPVAEHLATVLVQPLPLGGRAGAKRYQERHQECVRQFHGRSVARSAKLGQTRTGTIRLLEL